MKAIRIHRHGEPEEMLWEDAPDPEAAPGEAVVRHTAIGVNFIDVNQRIGKYPLKDFPVTLGMEGAGVVEAVAADVSEVAVGDRVAYAALTPGAYAERAAVPARILVKLPDAIDDQTAAAMMLKGMTAEYLLLRAHPVARGETILVHAAAGGVGLIACQWAKHLGAEVIGTVGSAEKAELARSHGCDHPIRYTEEDFVARVRELTGGAGVPVVYDGVGNDTFEGSLASLKARGLLVSYGTASGKIPPFDLFRLNLMGSLYVTSASLFTYNREREDLLKSAAALFDVVGSGAVRIEINHVYPLAEARRAHEDLVGRRTTGSVVLTP